MRPANDAPPDTFGAGFRSVLPLWLGIVPFGAVYAVTARAGGLSLIETQAMSVLVFAGGSQLSAAGLMAGGAGPWPIIVTTFLLNVRHMLYGFSLSRKLRPSGWRGLLSIHVMTDEAFGVSVAAGMPGVNFLLGAGLSVFASWNGGTLLGSLLGPAIPDPTRLGLDFVLPLAFLALLAPLLRGRRELLVAGLAGLLAVFARVWLPSGLALLVAAVGAAAVGAALNEPHSGVDGATRSVAADGPGEA